MSAPGGLPEIHEAQLDRPALDAWALEIDRAAEVLELQVKGTPRQHAQTARHGIVALAGELAQTHLRAIQVD